MKKKIYIALSFLLAAIIFGFVLHLMMLLINSNFMVGHENRFLPIIYWTIFACLYSFVFVQGWFFIELFIKLKRKSISQWKTILIIWLICVISLLLLANTLGDYLRHLKILNITLCVLWIVPLVTLIVLTWNILKNQELLLN